MRQNLSHFFGDAATLVQIYPQVVFIWTLAACITATQAASDFGLLDSLGKLLKSGFLDEAKMACLSRKMDSINVDSLADETVIFANNAESSALDCITHTHGSVLGMDKAQGPLSVNQQGLFNTQVQECFFSKIDQNPANKEYVVNRITQLPKAFEECGIDLSVFRK